MAGPCTEASADWASLQKRGFLVMKQFLSADQCAELAERYKALPAATDSIGFGVRWEPKHVAMLVALPQRLASACADLYARRAALRTPQQTK